MIFMVKKEKRMEEERNIIFLGHILTENNLNYVSQQIVFGQEEPESLLRFIIVDFS